MDEKNNLDAFQLFDLNGSESTFDYNPVKHILVYSVGCMIVYCELNTDKKLYVKYHEGMIGCLKFSKSGNYLLSIDKLFNPHIVLWELPTLEIFFHSYLALNSNYVTDEIRFTRERPKESKLNFVVNVFAEFLTNKNLLIIVNFDNKQYLYSLNISKEINLNYDSTIEVDSYCLGLKPLHSNNSFITLEEKIIKIWNFTDDNFTQIKLVKKIHTKQKLNINSLQVCEYLKLICLLNENGSCIILDDAGNFLISLTASKKEMFTSAFILNEKLLLGSDLGTLFIYTLNGYKCVFTYKCEHNLKNEYLLNKSEVSLKSYIPSGPSLQLIFYNEDKDLYILKYSDNSVLISHQLANLKKVNKVKHEFFSFSHFGKVNDILWLNDGSKTFLTSATDQSIMVWSYKGDKWVNSYFDLTKTVSSNLNNYSESCSVGNISSTCIKVMTEHPKCPSTVIAGDNKGTIYIFTVLKIPQLTKKITVGNLPIDSLSFSKNGEFLAIGFSSGRSILTEFSNECKLLIQLEDHCNQNSNLNDQTFSFAHVISKKGRTKNLHDTLSNENSLCILTLKNLNTFRIQNVTFKNNSFFKSTFKEHQFDTKVKKATIHPSEDYLIVLLNSNIISINKLETNGICGEIVPNMKVFDFKIDPSGLYIGLLAEFPSSVREEMMEFNSPKEKDKLNDYSNTQIKYIDKKSISYNMNDFKQSSTGLRSRSSSLLSNPSAPEKKQNHYMMNGIIIYELGTGKCCANLNNVSSISNFCFSNDGNFLTLCSDSGCISVWQLPNFMKHNISLVLEETKKNFGFWDSFRINYHQEPNEEVNYSKLITKSENLPTKSIKDSLFYSPPSDNLLETKRNTLKSQKIQTVSGNNSVQSIYLNISNKEDITQNSQFLNMSRRTNKSIQTSKLPTNTIPEINRLINKDPSIYPTQQSASVKYKGYNTKEQSNQILISENKTKLENLSKNMEDIRNKNIRKAMKELELNSSGENIQEKVDILASYSKFATASDNFYINNQKEIFRQRLPEPNDIDDVLDLPDRSNITTKSELKRNFMNLENENIFNCTNLYNKKPEDSIADDIDFVYDNIDNFEKMHNLKY